MATDCTGSAEGSGVRRKAKRRVVGTDDQPAVLIEGHADQPGAGKNQLWLLTVRNPVNPTGPSERFDREQRAVRTDRQALRTTERTAVNGRLALEGDSIDGILRRKRRT